MFGTNVCKKNNVPYIPIAKARGFTAHFGKIPRAMPRGFSVKRIIAESR